MVGTTRRMVLQDYNSYQHQVHTEQQKERKIISHLIIYKYVHVYTNSRIISAVGHP